MLEGLDDIDWSGLEHAYGSAADVPGQIRALRSDDPNARHEALSSLSSNVYHQGTRYEATAYAVPFLLALLADPATTDRYALLRLLTSIAIGFDESWLPGGFAIADERVRAEGGEEVFRAHPRRTGDDDGPAWYHSLDEEQGVRVFAWIELAAYDAVRAGAPAIRTLLADDDADMRMAAAYALAWFPEEAGGSLPALARATNDSETFVAATALVAIGLVGGPGDAGLVEPLLGSPDTVIRWAAAVALARLLGPAAAPEVARELLGWARGAAGPNDGVPFLDGDLGGYAGLALGQLGHTVADAAFDALLARLRAVSGTEALNVVGEALRQAFPEGRLPAGTRFSALADRQRRLVETLAGAPGSWRLGDLAFGNFSLAVSAYGLPRDADAMRDYASGGPGTSTRHRRGRNAPS